MIQPTIVIMITLDVAEVLNINNSLKNRVYERRGQDFSK